jgi:iron-sulfur cluster repair protein YtfE (RIC family)
VLISIGKRKVATDLVGLLLECHERIRSFARMAREIGRRDDLTRAEVAEGCSACERYFSEAFALHVEDEEQSVLPRLAGSDASLDAALADMRAEHASHQALLASMLEDLRAVRADPDAAAARARLYASATELAEAFERHLSLEEQVIFPALRDRLTQELEAQVLRELRARRQGGAHRA